MNDDAYMLLGFEPDETIGRNIKYIQSPEVSEHHDSYLSRQVLLFKFRQAVVINFFRYKETGVARVVGIARSVEAMHRDGSYFSVEIQVTEQVNSEGLKTFIGRLRHKKIEERVEKGNI